MKIISKDKKALTVMLVDDEKTWLDVLSIVLKDEKFKVVTAESGEIALKKMHSKKPDLILSDVRMPTMNGFDLFEKVRSDPKLKQVPYVFMSSLDDYDAVRTAKEIGVNDYIIKPIDMEDAKLIILDLLARFKHK
jgi:PleD family two-component response regulator